MTGTRKPLIALIAASAIGTAAMLWLGGRDMLMAVLMALELHPVAFACAFTVWALIANCLVLPAGSLSLIAGGAVLGAFVPAGIWFAAQLATAPLIYRAASHSQLHAGGLIERYLGPAAAHLLARAGHDGVWATAVLRLTPVIPSAPAALIGAAAGIRLRSFMLGSAVAGWIRPLYFASIGATAGSLARADSVSAASGMSMIAPLLVLCGASAVLFAARLYVNAGKP